MDVTERFKPHRFDGGAPARCRLRAGPCRDLNVMARADLAMQVDVVAAGADTPPAGHALIGADRALLRLDHALVLQVIRG